MIDTKRKEEISFSYLNAICAIAGIGVSKNVQDDDGIDAYLQKIIVLKSGGKRNVCISVQLKSTSQELDETNDYIKYDLKVKNYNDLCSGSTSQQLLFVLVLPDNECDWVQHSINELIIQKCMYWLDLSNSEKSNNSSTVTVRLSKQNYLSPQTLLQIFETVAEEGHL